MSVALLAQICVGAFSSQQRPLGLYCYYIIIQTTITTFSFFASFFLFIIHNFVWINLTSGSSSFKQRKGLLPMWRLNLLPLFSFGVHIVIRAIPIIKD